MIKPMFACDADFAKYPPKFPLIKQPKFDGVRGCNLGTGMTARTLRPFNNIYTTQFFSQHGFVGFDGELCAERENHPRLCHLTTSATNTIEGEPWLLWHIFDYITSETIHLPYLARLHIARDRIARLREERPILGAHVELMPYKIINNMAELETEIDADIDRDYEGTIVRKLDGPYKQGRSTAREGYLLRIKPYVDVDCVVDEVVEGQSNQNEATINRLGQTERSTHQENMVPNGMVGAMKCHLLEDVVFNGTTIHKKGDPIRVAAGCMTHDERALYFLEQHRVLKKVIVARIFPRGIKDKPRHPRYKSFRAETDYVKR